MNTKPTDWFYQWEALGRGWQVYEAPVELEPPFVPFFQYQAPQTGNDDGHVPTFLSSLRSLFKSSSRSKPSSSEELPEDLYTPEPIWFQGGAPIKSIGVSPSLQQSVTVEEAEQFLLMLSYSQAPIAFEVIGTNSEIQVQFSCHEPDYGHLKSQLQAYWPQTVLSDQDGYLNQKFNPDGFTTVADCALAQEFMRPLFMPKRFQPDILAGITGTMEGLQVGEFMMLQVLFQSAVNPWAESMMWSVTDGAGKPFFTGSPEMLPLTKEKIAHPLFGAVVRVMTQSATEARSHQLTKQFLQTLASVQNAGSNTLTVVNNDVYPFQAHVMDIFARQSRRTGMLLNTRELVSLVHLPTPSVVSNKLKRTGDDTRPVPLSADGYGLVLGTNTHQGTVKDVSLNLQQRLRHIHIIGATGTGKSTLLLRMMVQDIKASEGLTILDPHGDLIDSLIPFIPPDRVKDVIFLDPADADYPIGLNLLEAHSEIEKIVLSGDLVSMFRRFTSSWGDQMTTVLSNAIAAILESKHGGTLLDLRRFLVEKDFRQEYLQTVTDPHISYYWQYEFPQLRSNSIGSLVTRLNTFLRPKLIRNMMIQRTGIDFNEVLNRKKILLAKLSQGFIGEENSYLLGTLLVAKLHQAAQARQALPKHERLPHFLYIDEFQNFITPSMAGILSGARKYGLGLILAHQDLQQLFKQDAELGNSVISNPGTRICFRLGDFDAKKLESGFAHFDQQHLQSLGTGEAIARIGRAEDDFNFKTYMLPAVGEVVAKVRREMIISASREKYARKREEVEQEFTFSIPKPPMVKEKPVPKQEQIEKKSITEPTMEIIPEKVEKPPGLLIPEIQTKTPLEKAAEDFKQQERERKEVSDHIYLQTYIKRMAEARGFRAIIEKPTPDGKGRVDVALERDDTTIAIEISVTTPARHELHNISKCLKAKYQTVISTSKNKTHLDSIEKLSKDKLSTKQLRQVKFLRPQEIVQYLDGLTINKPKTEQRMKGYRVKVKYNRVSEIEAKRKQGEIARTVVESLKKKN